VTWQFKVLVLVPLMIFMLAAFAVISPPLGKELGRIRFAGPGSGSATLPLAAGEVAFWTDLDIHYEAVPPLAYQVDLSQAGRQVASASCEPLGSKSVTLGWLSTFDGVTHLERGRGRMSCTASVPTSAATTIQATLELEPQSNVALKRADLVIRQ
jgi:hypothetical protein